jgi:hypothetical protein
MTPRSLAGAGELFLADVPDPLRAVPHDHLLLGAGPTPPIGLGVDPARELGGGLDGSGVGGGLLGANGPALAISGGLGEDSTQLGVGGMSFSVFCFPPRSTALAVTSSPANRSICSRPRWNEEHSLPTSASIRRTPGEHCVSSTSSAASLGN